MEEHRQRTFRAAGEGEDDDVIVRPGIVGVRREEGQFLHAFLPQVQQHGGVNHGDGEAAQTVAVPGGEVLCRSAVIPLQESRVAHGNLGDDVTSHFQKADRSPAG